MHKKSFVICGTSGVGKSHLEKELEITYGFHRMITYTDRLIRANEKGDPARKCITKKEYDEMKKDFIFTLNYTGHRYGWRKDEFELNKDKNKVFVVTLEAMTRIIKDIPGIIPILLDIKLDNFKLIEERLKKREHFANKSKEEQSKISKKIQERLELVKKELIDIEYFKRIVLRNNGGVFTIKNDNTLYNDVIPFILEKVKNL